MAAPQIVRLDDVPSVPWKNGGGQTRELLVWPAFEGWRLRVSVAEIRGDGPFSPFPGIERWFSVIEGNGVVLRFGSEDRELRVGDDPLRFDGAAAPGCRLIDGPTEDLNLMCSGGRGTMAAIHPGRLWTDGFAQRGLFARVPGRLIPEQGEPIVLPAKTLVWQFESSPGGWRFESDSAAVEGAAVGWWLGYTPDFTPEEAGFSAS